MLFKEVNPTLTIGHLTFSIRTISGSAHMKIYQDGQERGSLSPDDENQGFNGNHRFYPTFREWRQFFTDNGIADPDAAVDELYIWCVRYSILRWSGVSIGRYQIKEKVLNDILDFVAKNYHVDLEALTAFVKANGRQSPNQLSGLCRLPSAPAPKCGEYTLESLVKSVAWHYHIGKDALADFVTKGGETPLDEVLPEHERIFYQDKEAKVYYLAKKARLHPSDLMDFIYCQELAERMNHLAHGEYVWEHLSKS